MKLPWFAIIKQIIVCEFLPELFYEFLTKSISKLPPLNHGLKPVAIIVNSPVPPFGRRRLAEDAALKLRRHAVRASRPDYLIITSANLTAMPFRGRRIFLTKRRCIIYTPPT